MAHAGGAPTKLDGHTIEEAQEYVDGIPPNALFDANKYIESCKDKFTKRKTEVDLPSDFGLALYLNVARSTLYEWAKINKDFEALMERLNNKQAVKLINNSLSGHYKSQKTVGAMLSRHGIVEKTETDNNHTGTLIVEALNYKDADKDELPGETDEHNES